jgi:hypothetical protein
MPVTTYTEYLEAASALAATRDEAYDAIEAERRGCYAPADAQYDAVCGSGQLAIRSCSAHPERFNQLVYGSPVAARGRSCFLPLDGQFVLAVLAYPPLEKQNVRPVALGEEDRRPS